VELTLLNVEVLAYPTIETGKSTPYFRIAWTLRLLSR